MPNALWFAPFAALVVLAGWFGWQMGKPMSETQIITFYAEQYVAETGGAMTECAAIPSDVKGARMEIICGAIRYVVGERGELMSREETGPET